MTPHVVSAVRSARSSFAGHVAAVCCLALNACTGSPASDTVRQWEVGEPSLEIGPSELEADYTFHRVAAVIPQSDGGLLVAETGGHTVRLYDADGRIRQTFGGRGGGPNEFGYIASVTRFIGDSILVFDPMAPKVTIWSATGEFGRSVRLDLQQRVQEVYGLSSGEFVAITARGGSVVRNEGGSVLDSADVVLLSATGEQIRTIARLPYRLIHGYASPTGSVLSSPLPFHPEGRFLAHDDGLWHGWSDEWSLSWIDTGRGLRADSLSISRPARPLDPSAVEAQIQAHLARFDTNADVEAQVRAQWARISWPAMLPAWDRILIDDTGLIWFREFVTANQNSARWVIAQPAGTAVAELALPVTIEALHIGADFVAGVARDELERERVVVLPLRRTEFQE